MQNITIDDGYKEFTINNDPNRVIRFNPTDINILERIKHASEEFNKLSVGDGTDFDSAVDTVAVIGGKIREQIDYIFGYPVSDVVFGQQSPTAPVKGVPYWERFMNAVLPVIRDAVKKENEESRKLVLKYTSAAKKI